MIINSIDTRDISFVVQGAIDKNNTKFCLDSIRRNFPGSTIILSTWEKSNVKGLDFDEVVFNTDPGSAVYDSFGNCNNINRQIITSYNGLKTVKTKYAAKVRNDLIFDGPNFIYYFNKFSLYNEEYRKVKGRMIALTVFSRLIDDVVKYEGDYEVVCANYNISDWFQFGYTDDVLKFWSVPTIPDISSFSHYYLGEKVPFSGYYYSKNSPERYITSVFAGFDPDKTTRTMMSGRNKRDDSLRFLVNNFIILDYQHSRIYSKKYERMDKDVFDYPGTAVGLFFYADFLHYYKKYCDKSFVIPDNIDKKNRKKKLKAAKDFLWRNKIREYRHKVFEKIKHQFSFIKKIIRCILPAYRVGHGTRDILLRFQAEQRDSLNFLHYKVDSLSHELEKKSAEIKKLNKQMSELMEIKNDKFE